MTTAKAPQLPSRIERLSEMPQRMHSLYQSDFDGNYRLTHEGNQLAAYRKMVAENPGIEPPPPRKSVKFSRSGWAQLLAVMERSERGYFLRAAATGAIKIER